VLIPAIKKGMYGLAVCTVIASLIAAYYYLKVVKVMYFDEAKEKNDHVRSLPLGGLALAGAAFNVFFILSPSSIVAAATTAAEVLFG
jgi:NADH-quinone oxidoreductase subunit N